jgi:anti-sigma regulatory factor (Ser/Thr protein kinase)
VTESAWLVTPQNHAVNFYDHDAEIVAEVARFVADGLSRGERVIIVATANHRDALDEVLLQYGADAVRARITGRYLTLDARETLAKFMVDGMPDVAKFHAAVGAVIEAAADDGCAVRVFGEMVALLWAEGNVAGTVELEALWNGLATTQRFSLLCAYPTRALTSMSLNDTNRVCALHSEVLPPRSYSKVVARGVGESEGAFQGSDVFVPVPAAVPAARRFVERVLRLWGEDDLLVDASLVISELATNAVEHAGSPFRVRLHRIGEIVRISIEDVGPARPQLRVAAPDDFGGRGVAIVRELAQLWGCDSLPDGKIVWAELRSRRS